MQKGQTVLGLGIGKLLFFILAALILLLCGLLSKQAVYEIMISILSVITILYIAQGKRIGCALGVVFTILFGIVSLTRQLYGIAAFDFFCGLPSYLFGFFLWKKHQNAACVKARKMSNIKLFLMIIGVGVLFSGFYIILKAMESSQPFFDGLTLVLGLAGMMLLTLRYIEQWYFNMIANFSATILWLIKTIESIENFNFLIISIIAVLVNLIGLISWQKNYKDNTQTEKEKT